MNKKHSSHEWEEILGSLRKSGKSQAAFCKENNIPLSTLQYQLLKKKEKNTSSNFVKVPFPIERTNPTVLRIKTTYCTIEFSDHIKEEELTGLLRSLKAVSV